MMNVTNDKNQTTQMTKWQMDNQWSNQNQWCEIKTKSMVIIQKDGNIVKQINPNQQRFQWKLIKRIDINCENGEPKYRANSVWRNYIINNE